MFSINSFHDSSPSIISSSDQKLINRLKRIFSVGKEHWDTPINKNLVTPLGPKSFIIDLRGVVLQSYITPLLLKYEAASYSFTNERIQFLDFEDNFIRMLPLSRKILALSRT